MSSKEQLISAKIMCYCSVCNNVKIAHKTSNTIQKIMAYKIMDKIDKFNRSGIYQLKCQNCGNTLDKLADHSAGGKMNIFSLSSTKIQIRHMQNTYTILDIHLAPWNV
jgi:hypothetical protein